MITIRNMQVADALAVSEIEQEIFSRPWSYQGFVDSLNLGNTECIWQWMKARSRMLQ